MKWMGLFFQEMQNTIVTQRKEETMKRAEVQEETGN